MSAPDDQASPTAKSSREVVAAAKGPAKDTSNMSVLFFTRLLNWVTAPKVPIWLFGMNRLAPSLICKKVST